MKTEFTCDRCKTTITHESDISTGYGVTPDGKKHCFMCCGEMDYQSLETDNRITLYLTETCIITNWPGTLKIVPYRTKTGRHNIAGIRTDIWFKYKNNHWHGVTYGHNSQLLHCRRTKKI